MSPEAVCHARTVLHIMPHGLGDVVQFTAVLRHIKAAHPAWENHVVCRTGRGSALRALAHRVFEDTEPARSGYDEVIHHDFRDSQKTLIDAPSTKATWCIRDKFHLQPRWDLLRYSIEIGDAARERVQTYLDGLPTTKGFVGIHYQGTTSLPRKNLSHETIQTVCSHIVQSGYVPLILDWHRSSPLPDNRRIYCPDVNNPLWMGLGTGDAETLAALIERCSLFIGIDSGPQKVAFTTSTPTIAVWTGFHPLHFCDRADNAIHLVPAHHQQLVNGNRQDGIQFFQQSYVSATYGPGGLELEICRQISRNLGLEAQTGHDAG